MAALLGYLLSLDDAYDFNSLKFHFWAGIVTLILSFSLCVLHRIKGKENAFLVRIFRLLIALSVAGHKGGQITLGEDYLSTAELFEEPNFIIVKDSIDLYKEVVQVVLR